MQEIRWKQRFQNYEKAFLNFEETVACIKNHGINKIYVMARIQAYEIAFELAWKTMKDYLEYSGVKVDTPRETIKEAFMKHILADGQVWIEMMEARNKTSHTYKEEFANELADEILSNYAQKFAELSGFFKGKLNG